MVMFGVLRFGSLVINDRNLDIGIKEEFYRFMRLKDLSSGVV